ncbi:MAG: nucleotidyltransferase family protein [Oscillospiraceae bacterium]|nr:nucleotidyltransferase family protein [Oscillospiraceae bacterium]
MAAGAASRFGGGKLAARVGGKSLFRRALEAVPADRCFAVAVVAHELDFLALAERFRFLTVDNDRPELGVSRTIRLGLEALGNCQGVMFLVADQPFLRRESAEKAMALFAEHPDRIVALAHGGQRGNPCVFPASLFPELLALEGDTGGSAVIRRHEELLLLLETPAEELMDVDTPEQLPDRDRCKKA